MSDRRMDVADIILRGSPWQGAHESLTLEECVTFTFGENADLLEAWFLCLCLVGIKSASFLSTYLWRIF